MPVNVVCVGVKGDEQPVNVVLEEPITVELLKQRLLCQPDVYLCCCGEPLDDDDVIGDGDDYSTTIINVHHQVVGGKGGFGSLIRATRSQINKSSDRSACRDISGRRMRDVKAEKKIADWIAAEPERKRQRAEKKMKKLKKLTEQPKHKFTDHAYMEQIRSTEEGMADSLKQGLAAAVAGKRTREESGHGETSKRPKMWMGTEHSESSCSEDEDSNDEDRDSSNPSSEESVQHDNQTIPENNGTASVDNVDRDSSSPSSEESAQQDNETINGTASVDNSVVLQDNPAVAVSQDNEHVPENNSTASEYCVTEAAEESAIVKTEVCASEQPVETKNGTVSSKENHDEPLDLARYSSEEELLSVGVDVLKAALQKLGLKCGGTPQERAHRLFSTKGKSIGELDSSLFAKKGKKKRT